MIKYIYRVLLGFDKLFNAIAGGNEEIAISARVGYYSMNEGRYWRFLRSLINFSFYPVDGQYHCEKAAAKEINNDCDIFRNAGVIDFIALTLIIFITCPLIAGLLYLINVPNFILGKR